MEYKMEIKADKNWWPNLPIIHHHKKNTEENRQNKINNNFLYTTTTATTDNTNFNTTDNNKVVGYTLQYTPLFSQLLQYAHFSVLSLSIMHKDTITKLDWKIQQFIWCQTRKHSSRV